MSAVPARAATAVRPRPEVLRVLAAPRSAADRLRARMTTAATAGVAVAVLMAASVAGIPDDPTLEGYQAQAAQPGLAPYLAQAGLRPGAALGALLLVLPFAALVVQALRVGSLSLRREAGLLALAGATPADLRRLRVARTRTAFARGGLWAAPAHLVVWLLLGVALPPGLRLLPTPQWWLPAAWLGVVGLLTGAGALVGRRSPRSAPGEDADAAEPFAIVSPGAAPGRAPSAWWAMGTGAAAAAVLTWGARLVGGTPSTTVVIALLLVLVALLAGCAAVLLARRAARSGDPRQRRRRRGSARALRRARGDVAVAVLAAAQRRADPAAAGTVGAVLFVCGLSFGVEAVLSSGLLGQQYGYSLREVAFYVGGAATAAAVAVVGIGVALLALALALGDHLLATRRAVAATAALGLEPQRLLAVQTRALTGAAVPAVVAGTLVGGLLYAVPYVLDRTGQAAFVLPAVLVTAALAGLVVAGACRGVVALLASRVRAAAALEHLRTP